MPRPLHASSTPDGQVVDDDDVAFGDGGIAERLQGVAGADRRRRAGAERTARFRPGTAAAARTAAGPIPATPSAAVSSRRPGCRRRRAITAARSRRTNRYGCRRRPAAAARRRRPRPDPTDRSPTVRRETTRAASTERWRRTAARGSRARIADRWPSDFRGQRASASTPTADSRPGPQ